MSSYDFELRVDSKLVSLHFVGLIQAKFHFLTKRKVTIGQRLTTVLIFFLPMEARTRHSFGGSDGSDDSLPFRGFGLVWPESERGARQ